MPVNEPLKSLLALAKAEFSNKHNINDFIGTSREIKSIPGLSELIDEHLDGDYTTTLGRKLQGVGVSEGMFELQKHDISIEAHTDDVDVGLYFGMYVLETKLATRGGNRCYVRSPSFFYVDPIDGRKKEKIMSVGSFVAFNPRKKHSVAFYGYDYTVMLFTVKKITKKGK